MFAFLTPAVKKIVGYVLVGVSGLAIIIRLVIAVLRMETGAEWESNVYLWSALLVTLCFGITWAVPETEVDPEVSRRLRRRMILIYLALSMGLAALFLAAHILIGRTPPPSVPDYAPVILFGVITTYLIAYVFFIRKADYAGGGAIFTLLFLMGLVIAPIGVIETYNTFTQEVEIVESGQGLANAKSSYVKFNNLELDRERWLWWRRTWLDSREGKYNAEYRALMPVVTDPADTVYKVWIDLQYSESFDNNLSKEEKEKRRDEFYDRSHDSVDAFTPDSVVFFDQSLRESDKVLTINNYPTAKESILLLPRYESLSAFGHDKLYTSLFIYIFVTLGFWGYSSGVFISDEMKEKRAARRRAKEEAPAN